MYLMNLLRVRDKLFYCPQQPPWHHQGATGVSVGKLIVLGRQHGSLVAVNSKWSASAGDSVLQKGCELCKVMKVQF